MFERITRLFSRTDDRRAQRKYPCCRLARNLRAAESPRPDIAIEVCVCGRRHIVVQADSGVIGVTGAAVGR